MGGRAQGIPDATEANITQDGRFKTGDVGEIMCLLPQLVQPFIMLLFVLDNVQVEVYCNGPARL